MPNQKAAEQIKVDEIYARLDELRQSANQKLNDTLKVSTEGTHQNRGERDAFSTLYESRLAQLNAVEDRLVFGKLVNCDGKIRHIGRLGISTREKNTLLTDWRAPAAVEFYRATPKEPGNVAIRRHIAINFRKVTSIDDEIISPNCEVVIKGFETDNLKGDGALFKKLQNPTTGKMNDIVDTIQAEQDKIIRSSMDGMLIIQGGPGTGKTAVVLHRAAYLLYNNRKRLAKGGVLLIGPNQAFLHYIDQVIPSLGETGVVTTTLSKVLPQIIVGRDETEIEKELKGHKNMIEIIKNSIKDRKQLPLEDKIVRTQIGEIIITIDDTKNAMNAANQANLPHNLAYQVFIKAMIETFVEQFISRNHGVGSTQVADREVLASDFIHSKEILSALNQIFTPLTPERLIGELWSNPPRLQNAAPNLTESERRNLFQQAFTPWGVSDIALIDEAASQLGDYSPKPQARRDPAQDEAELQYAKEALQMLGESMVDAQTLADRYSYTQPNLEAEESILPAYGHIIVDEAQELSYMQWNMLKRRCPRLSMTIAGDLAQRTSAAGSANWNYFMDQLFEDNYHIEELTVNYRNPSEVAELASKFAKANDLYVNQKSSLRSDDQAIQILKSPDPLESASQKIVELVQEFVEEDGSGRIAVICSKKSLQNLSQTINQSLQTAFDEAQYSRLINQNDFESQVVLITPENSKGLEFDGVLLYEPAELFEDSAGLAVSDIYVAITRPTKKLVIVHKRDLPEGLE